MKLNIGQIWGKTLEVIVKKPVILLPFIIFGFIQALALEVLYFSARRPISFIMDPIARKFFGEGFIRYPGNLLLVPKVFYFVQTAIYVTLGILLIAISVTILKHVILSLPLKPSLIVRNAMKRYPAYLIYGILTAILIFLLKKLDVFILTRFIRLMAGPFPNASIKSAPFITPIVLVLSNTLMQLFLVCVIPIIVFCKNSFIKSLLRSIAIGVRNFFSLFVLIFVPLLVYLPVSLLTMGGTTSRLLDITFPEMQIIILGVGILVAIFVDCFVVISASHFILDRVQVEKIAK